MLENQVNRVEEGASLNGAAVHVGSSIQVASDMVTWRLSGRRSKWCAYDLPGEDSLDEIFPTWRGNCSRDTARIRSCRSRTGMVEDEGVNDSLNISCVLE